MRQWRTEARNRSNKWDWSNLGSIIQTYNPFLPWDPVASASEDQQVASAVSTVTPSKYWQDKFVLPVGLPYCIKEWFGTPRTYAFNGSDYNYFHSGVDYGVCSAEHPFDIYAAAQGKVVFVGLFTARGNTTIVDNGWGGLHTVRSSKPD